MQRITLITLCAALFAGTTASAQSTLKERAKELGENIIYQGELQSTLSGGSFAPLWLNANKHGLSSVNKGNGYMRGAISRSYLNDTGCNWAIGYGADFAVAYDFTSTLVVQQLFAEVRYKRGLLSVGSKERAMELKNNLLSSGSQTFGINARPIPQVRLELPEFWDIPYTQQWVGVKGHLAYGKYTDSSWQKEFVTEGERYTEGALHHTKAGYLRFGNEQRFPLTAVIGLEMATQFGGTSYNAQADMPVIKMNSGLKGFWHALIPGGRDATDDVYDNATGNWVGSWVASLNWKFETWNIRAYYDNYFEDHSQLFFMDYDGYVEGPNYQTEKIPRKYVWYSMKDALYGLELTLPKNRYVSSLVYECLYTKYQSSSIYHDQTENVADHIGGNDNYYNHNIYTGWQHWGQAIGNPLYRSPIYNQDGKIVFDNNRFIAHHFGLSGSPLTCLNYRLLMTYQEGYGTYSIPYIDKKYNSSFLAEVSYSPRKVGKWMNKGWSATAAFAFDKGSILGDNKGAQLTLRKQGIFGNQNN